MKSWHDKNPAERMLSTRSALVTAQPFFGCIALSQKLVADESVGTAAVDGKSLFYAPSFVAKLSELECMGVYMHEIFHLVHLHHVRRNGREMADWNRACDFAINPAVIKAVRLFPAGVLLDPAYAGYRLRGNLPGTLQAAKPKPAEDGEDGEKTPQDASEDGEDNGEPQDGSEDGEDAGEPSNGPGEGNGENWRRRDWDRTGRIHPGQCGALLTPQTTPPELAEAQAETEGVPVRQAVSVAKAANGGAVPDSAGACQ